MGHDRTAYVEIHVQTGTQRRVPVVCWYDPTDAQWHHQLCAMPSPQAHATRADAAAAGAVEFAHLDAQARHVFDALMRDLQNGSIRTQEQYRSRMLALVRIADQISPPKGDQT